MITIAPQARCTPLMWLPAASLKFKPSSPATAPEQTVIKPAAGHLIVRRPRIKMLTTSPPIIAVSTPIAAGNPLGLAIPKLRGIASKNTRKPERASVVQFCLSPSNPSFGISRVFILKKFVLERLLFLIPIPVQSAYPERKCVIKFDAEKHHVLRELDSRSKEKFRKIKSGKVYLTKTADAVML